LYLYTAFLFPQAKCVVASTLVCIRQAKNKMPDFHIYISVMAPPPRSRSPRRKPTAVGGASDERVEAAVAARRVELAKARESSVGLFVRPVRTLSLFGRALSEFALTTLARLAVSRPVVYAGYPFLLGWLITHLAFPDLYAPPTCIAGSGSATAAAGGGPLYLPALYVYEFGWWLVLGILSSIGFGSGLHSGIMFLWPFVMRVVAEVEVRSVSLCFPPSVPSAAGWGLRRWGRDLTRVAEISFPNPPRLLP
jgi:hypothetical protein